MLAIDDDIRRILAVPGVRSVSLVDYHNDHVVAVLGRDPLTERERARESAGVIRAILAHPAFRPFGPEAQPEPGESDLEDIVLTGRSAHLLVAMLSTGPRARLCVQVRVDRGDGDLTSARTRLRHLVARHAGGSALPPELPSRRNVPRQRASDPVPRAEPTDPATLRRVLDGLRHLCAPAPRLAPAGPACA